MPRPSRASAWPACCRALPRSLSVLITKWQPVFATIKWVGAAYLCVLAIQALRSARVGRYPASPSADEAVRPVITMGLRQSFLCNITNPKIIAFNLAVFPQFLGTRRHRLPSSTR